MTEKRLLPIYTPPGITADLEAIKKAKADLNLPVLVVPIDAVDERASGLRIIAIGNAPDWVCDYWLTGENTSHEDWMAALKWVLGTFDDDRATTCLDVLSMAFGGKVQELHPATLATIA